MVHYLKCYFQQRQADGTTITTDKVMSSEDSNPAATPTPGVDTQGDGRWMSLHNHFVSNSKDKEPDVLFVGDSLVQLLYQFEVWRDLFSPLHALNFGVGGDATQHVLWRLSNGELGHISPKVVVLWVGTNNHGHTAEQICGGIMAIVQLIKDKLPKAYTLVLMNVVPSGVWKLLPRMNQTCKGLQFFSEVLADFF
ncbi:platelet-activating factor acetylhydrolase IB subunit alpha1-like isoform X7 [Oncorhynchus keta]|uniref:platelet-activating factor acetylhydrolase IB subunit alpha1-like isoform X7 n=1 Tax=Oncorhynchus keta TaxID=8018 RepID=UPI00227D305C|nr:platelet-activating factor acetylhydrolase IB subunit alpha1-like isoform X7 [Oncorhynchus keta]